jgi:murein DD-endopeptidase MepM/ murein hydrolase activator NlpD
MATRPKHRNSARTRIRWSVSVVAVGALMTGAAVLGEWGHSPGPAPVSPQEPVAAIEVPGEVEESQPTVNVEQAVAEAKVRSSEALPDLSAMTLEGLQKYAVRMQTEFVQASLAYEEAETQAEQANEAADVAEGESVQAKIESENARTEFKRTISKTYATGITGDPTLSLLTGRSKSVGEYLEQVSTLQTFTRLQADSVQDVAAAEEVAADAAERAAALRNEADAAEDDAQVLLDDIQGRASKVAAASNKALANSTDGVTLFASAEQDARNRAARSDWEAYLSSLDRAQVVPPASADLSGGPLPYGLVPLAGVDGDRVPGVAAKQVGARTLTVLPRETIAAVSRAFAAVGKPYVEEATGPESYGCSGFVAEMYAPSGFGLDSGSPVAQYEQVRLVREENAQVGDLLFFRSKTDGVQHVGLNLGGGLVLSSDASAQQVGVQVHQENVFAVARPVLGLDAANVAPVSAEESDVRCGGNPDQSAGMGMVYPMKEGTYRFSAEFGDAGPHWSSGYHTGLDFAAPVGAAVVASKGGTATVSASPWGGPNLVTIDHGDDLVTVYAHLSQAFVKTGDVVKTGALVGTVGAEGNVTGPHLHFEVLVGGVKIDPLLFLSGGGDGQAGWGGFTNGMIPPANLCGLQGVAAGHLLRCDAAAAFNAMSQAYATDMGSALCITDSYRSYAGQVRLYATKPSLAAVPGTSNHGWALALDACGGIESWGTPAHEWMQLNAPKFGWVNPVWARPGGGREEPWHWEFGAL